MIPTTDLTTDIKFEILSAAGRIAGNILVAQRNIIKGKYSQQEFHAIFDQKLEFPASCVTISF